MKWKLWDEWIYQSKKEKLILEGFAYPVCAWMRWTVTGCQCVLRKVLWHRECHENWESNDEYISLQVHVTKLKTRYANRSWYKAQLESLAYGVKARSTNFEQHENSVELQVKRENIVYLDMQTWCRKLHPPLVGAWMQICHRIFL